MALKNCALCGAEFIATTPQKFCSDECRKEHQRKEARKKYTLKPRVKPHSKPAKAQRRCKMCRAPVEGRRVYCSACLIERTKQQSAKSSKARYATILESCKEDCFHCPFPDCRLTGWDPGASKINTQVREILRNTR